MASKRIYKELTECTTSPPPDMKVCLWNESDLHTWKVALAGPASSVYEGGNYAVLVTLPTDYPFKPPTVRILTRIYHPNVTNDNLGNICLSILKPENWKPATKVSAVLQAVRQLLVEPQPDDPLEARIADEYRNDRNEFEKNARQYVTRYARGPPVFGDAPPAAEKSK
ncbi:ubiquitin-conjugating enzyme [Sodiomyces alkalinus F11]|uniref:E2 ubiquitin-conjugating enzyme n=1 Tax=Sodiomyces alkalinus (strain CBS 110278 / VKM F-3762 / F11) TaxID=1314773 RepID=A0A3N2PQE1_SODAK|nr:ubiquitin-conjugating enzyme [Sodiomyces alkalinus F11]ROT36684.1 ubiquitin-conjugating enzyme [Sodiomyces alkalinus F11]